MPSLWSIALLLVLLLAAAGGGYAVKNRLPDPHRPQEAIELARLGAGLIVTFVAIVLGLLVTSVKAGFDAAWSLRGSYAGDLVQLDDCLRTYGPETSAIREELRSYAASSIAATWPDEPPPKGVRYPDAVSPAGGPGGGNPAGGPGESWTLEAMLDEVGQAIRRLSPPDLPRQRLADDCRQRYQELVKSRWGLIESERSSISAPFYWVLLFWLVILFLSLGLSAPRGALSAIVIVLAAIAITAAMFVILDLDIPYGGLFGIPSDSMRNALADMMR